MSTGYYFKVGSHNMSTHSYYFKVGSKICLHTGYYFKVGSHNMSTGGGHIGAFQVVLATFGAFQGVGF